jgi:hypothetical protein
MKNFIPAQPLISQIPEVLSELNLRDLGNPRLCLLAHCIRCFAGV